MVREYVAENNISGFPTDPCNEPAFKLSYSARRENITTFSVTGTVLDPLFSRKEFQVHMEIKAHSEVNTYYGVSQNGWMETKYIRRLVETFARNNKGHPMLLLFDGHTTHISIHIIE